MSCSDSKKTKKRKSNKSGNMGDVLGKECGDGEKDELQQNTCGEDVREEADGAPSGDEQSSQSSGDLETFELKPGEELKGAGVQLDENALLPFVSAVAPQRDEKCMCEACKDRRYRELAAEQLKEMRCLQSYWMELRQYIRTVYRNAMEGQVGVSDEADGDEAKMKDLVNKLCARDPHQLFQRLESQVQEFVIEAKVRQLELLHRDQEAPELAQMFLTGLLEGYDKLCVAARHLNSLLQRLEMEHLQRFNLTWEVLNKHLYQSCVYTDPLVQNNLPHYIGQLRNMLPGKNQAYSELVHHYLAFDDEMTLVGAMWRDTETLVHEYNQEQATMKAKQRMLREDWELFKAQKKYMQQKMWKPTSDLREYEGHLMALACWDSLESPRDSSPEEGVGNGYCAGCSTRRGCPCDECAVTHLLTCGGLISGPETAATVYSHKVDVQEFRVEAEGSEQPLGPPSRSPPGEGAVGGGEEGAENLPQSCECHVCTAPVMSPVDLMENYECQSCVQQGVPAGGMNLNLHAGGFHLYPHIHGTGGGGDAGSLYPHLYNIHPSLLTQLGSKHSRLGVHLQDQLQMPVVGADSKQHLQLPSPVSELLPPGLVLETLTPAPPPVAPTPPPAAASPCAKAQNLQSSASTQTSPSKAKVHQPVVAKRPASTTAPTTSSPVTATTHHPPPSRASPAGMIRYCTTQTSSAGHTHTHSHQSLPDVVKSAAPHRPSPGAKVPPHSCHRTLKNGGSIEPIKRVACTDYLDNEALDMEDSSSQDDTCSERSSSTTTSTQRDSRHCDCCYCEVFGHGLPSVAPVSRNYQEMRERLRLLLTKKKAKCKLGQGTAGGVAPQSAVSSAAPEQQPPASTAARPSSAVPSSTPTPAAPAPQGPPHQPSKQGSPDPLQPPPVKDPRDLEALLDFIEGNQSNRCKDAKKAAKKARQKQKKIEEKERKDQQEAERQRLAEIQNKTPEVTITVVNSSKLQPPPPQVVRKPSPPQPQPTPKKPDPQPAKESPSSSAQMVTIKRVMESNGAEPTVTITLKGATPDKDKVLFTLVNGQGDYLCQQQQQQKPDPKSYPAPPSQQNAKSGKTNQPSPAPAGNGKKKKNKGNGNQSNHPQQPAAPSKPAHSTAKAAPPPQQPAKAKAAPSVRPPVTNHLREEPALLFSTMNHLANPTAEQISSAIHSITAAVKTNNVRPERQHQAFNLENFRLPPGITITKVETPMAAAQRKAQEVSRPPQETVRPPPVSQQGNGNRPFPGSISQSIGGANVIVVDTGRMKEDLDAANGKEANEDGGKKKNKKKGKNGQDNGHKQQQQQQQQQQHQQQQQRPQQYTSNGSVQTNNKQPGNLPRMQQQNGSKAAQQQKQHQQQQQQQNVRYQGVTVNPSTLSQQAIIKVNGSMVTIRNPAFQHAFSMGGGGFPGPQLNGGMESQLPPPPGKQGPTKQPPPVSAMANGYVKGKENAAGRYARGKAECNGIAEQQQRGARQGKAMCNQNSGGGAVHHPANLVRGQVNHVAHSRVPANHVMASRVQANHVAAAARLPANREAAAAAAAADAKKKKKKKKGAGGQGHPDDWHLLDSVFAPKDIDLENGDIDDDERELEAFKRFCFNSVPPKRKEKVHLNIKDIVLKKKSSAIGCS